MWSFDWASGFRRFKALNWIGVALLSAACSDGGGANGAYGTLALEVEAPRSIRTTSATYLLANHRGEVMRLGSLTPDLEPLEFSVPQGADYLLSVNAFGRKRNGSFDLECEAAKRFDVFAHERNRVVLKLACQQLWTDETAPDASVPKHCGIQTFVVGPLRQLVGSRIHASVTTVPVDARVRWRVKNSDVGYFTHRESAPVRETDFVCAAEGTSALTLSVTSAECHDEASVEISCVSGLGSDGGD